MDTWDIEAPYPQKPIPATATENDPEDDLEEDPPMNYALFHHGDYSLLVGS